MAKKKLTVAEEFYIEQNPKKFTLSQLADELEKPESAIKPFYKELEVKKEFTEIEPLHPTKKGNPKEKNYNVTIWSEQQSALADESRSQRTGRVAQIMKTCVHKCRKKQ